MAGIYDIYAGRLALVIPTFANAPSAHGGISAGLLAGATWGSGS